MIKIQIGFQRYEIKEIIYKENEEARADLLGLENFKKKYSYKLLNYNIENKTQELKLLVEVGKDEDPLSVSYIRIQLKVYLYILKDGKDMDRDDLENGLKVVLNLYLYGKIKTIISSITDQSTKLMPYFIQPIFKLEKIK